MKDRTSTASDGGPVLVDTENGVSVCYRSRFLYSRRNPLKSPEEIAARTDVPPGTLVLLVSPVLDYGIRALLQKLPEDSFVLGVEQDKTLFDFSSRLRKESHPRFATIYTPRPEDAVRFADETLMGRGYAFRRAVRLDFSAGGSLNPEFYRRTQDLLEEFISTFWKNRVTLIHFGRNYARNIFKNCARIPAEGFSFRAENVTKPVLVAGAGPSLDTHLSFIRRNREAVFLLAVDAAASALAGADIVPDAVVTVESQIWIDGAFCGSARAGGGTPVFADLSSRAGARRDNAGKDGVPVCFFFTPYTKSAFLQRLRAQNLADIEIPPLGSVGLSALFIAGKIMEARAVRRKESGAASAPSAALPVFFTGLDFSWGNGFSHARGSFPVRRIFARANRLAPAEQMQAEISCPAHPCARGGADGCGRTTDSMLRYAGLCAAYFSAAGFFRLGNGGLPADFPSLTEEEAERRIASFRGESEAEARAAPCGNRAEEPAHFVRTELRQKARDFLRAEESRLLELKAMLTGKAGADGTDGEQVLALLKELDYLYIHFPDYSGQVSDRPDFLKRVRVELDFFLKTIRTALQNCGGAADENGAHTK